ncbi:MAG: zinc ribbon domain-containing protein [Chloroflexi bacterium]|nr:zinc ribbon domain-containing protein [Chloroflexota bacterium]MBI1856570.1 zinc ribbon domain-containing protein [Chloroflexota bacterium]MBI3339009.1 zinc ribbon domain-containing protein [Chloroflexota bacterium]
MRKWLVFLFILGTIAFPFSVRAQSDIKLAGIQVQLWPEYDQPSMLVIYDFQVATSTALPASVSIRIPKDAKLSAVAQTTANGLVNAEYDGPAVVGDWQIVNVNITDLAVYRVEYYEPISKTGMSRQFTYVWPADYATDDFSISVRMPTDTTEAVMAPALSKGQGKDGATYLQNDFGALPAGQSFSLDMKYTRTTDTLGVPQQKVQPSVPLNSETEGRVMFSNYLPYILGALGVTLIVGGLIYFWRSSRSGQSKGRKRQTSQNEKESDSDIYCHQCGARARIGDRFCRVCGTKLRLGE